MASAVDPSASTHLPLLYQQLTAEAGHKREEARANQHQAGGLGYVERSSERNAVGIGAIKEDVDEEQIAFRQNIPPVGIELDPVGADQLRYPGCAEWLRAERRAASRPASAAGVAAEYHLIGIDNGTHRKVEHYQEADFVRSVPDGSSLEDAWDSPVGYRHPAIPVVGERLASLEGSAGSRSAKRDVRTGGSR